MLPAGGRILDLGSGSATLSLADTQQFGILRFVVRDWRTMEEAEHGIRATAIS